MLPIHSLACWGAVAPLSFRCSVRHWETYCNQERGDDMMMGNSRTALSILMVGIVLILATVRSTIAQERTWTASSGREVKGELVRQTADTVSLRIAGKEKPVIVPLQRLSEADRKFARNIWFNAQDQRQYDFVVEHLRNLHERPKTVQRLLIELHKEFPESPYAGLWASVAYNIGNNQHSRARTLLRNVIHRIEKQQEVDPQRHRMTLASAKNNLAVCYIKERKGDSASARLVEAIKIGNVLTPALRSNAEQLIEISSDELSAIVISQVPRTKLLRTIALAETSGAGTALGNGWHYSLDFNLPDESYGASKLDGIDAPRPELQLLAQGTGFVVAPGIVLTSKQVVQSTNYKGPKLITVVTNPTHSHWKGEVASRVSIEAVRSIATGARKTTSSFRLGDNASSSASTYTDYDYVRSNDGHPSAELAAIHVPNLRVMPVEISKRSPGMNSPCDVWGYARGKDAIRKGLIPERGQVLSSISISKTYGGSRYASLGNAKVTQTSARVLGGNRGGPFTDSEFRVIGVAFDTPESGSEASGYFFGAEELRRWFYTNVQTSSLVDPSDASTAEDRRLILQEATLPVLCWGLRQSSESSTFGMVADVSNNSGGLYLRDGWCVACDGKGFIACGARGCNNGMATTPRIKQVGVNPITGKPITGMARVKVRCKACSGRGGSRCPHCNQGRL